MPRPTEQGLSGTHDTQGFSPTQASNFTTQVVAPLDVDAAPTQAMALAKALGHANDAMQPVLGDMMRMKGASDEAAGEAAGALGATSADQSQDAAATTHGFAVGLAKVNTQMTAYKAADQAKAFAAQNPNMPMYDSTDENGKPVPGLMTNIDNIYKQAFPAGEEKDPEAARAMAPILQHTINEIAGQKNLQEIRGAQQKAEDLITGQIQHDVLNGSNLFNKDDALATLHQVYGPDQRGALSALVHAVGEAGASTGNPDIIRQTLPVNSDFGGGVRLNPEDQAYLDNATARATEAQKRNQHAVVGQSEDNISSMMLDHKDPLAAIQNYLKLPGANADFALHAYDWYYKSTKERQADSVDNNSLTWDMDRAVANGDITNGGQLMGWLAQNGVGNTKAGNQLLQRGMNNIRSFQNTNADDPNYRAGASNIATIYSPARDPLTQKFLHDSANSQQAGAMLDYRTLYNSYVRQPSTSSTEAARKAQAAVQEKWGDPIEDAHGQLKKGGFKSPMGDSQQSEVIRNAATNPAAFHASGITSRDIQVLHDSGMISDKDAMSAAQLIIQKHQLNK